MPDISTLDLVYLPFTHMIHPTRNVVCPKYSKHLTYTVAHTIDFVCSKRINHGLNHLILLSLFKFFGRKYMLN